MQGGREHNVNVAYVHLVDFAIVDDSNEIRTKSTKKRKISLWEHVHEVIVGDHPLPVVLEF